MAEIRIYGAFDDTVIINGCQGADEFTVYGSVDMGPVMWRGDFIAPGGAEVLQVHALFTPDGCWHFSVGQALDDESLPSWPITITQHENGYSTLLTIEAPDGVRLTNVWPKAASDA
jgi:hypothetical protein